MWIGSSDYRGWEVPLSTICKLGGPGNQWFSPSPTPKAQKPGAPMSQGRRRWRSQLKKRANLPFLSLFVLFRLSVDWMMPTCIVEGDLFFFFFFGLHWVFVAAHGLSLVAASGGCSSLRCEGSSFWWLLSLRSTGSRHGGFSSCGAWVQ